MPALTAVADIDFLSSIPEEILQGSGPYGSVYDLQLKRDQANRHLESLRESLYYEISREERGRGIGSLTPAHERVENDPGVKAARERAQELGQAVRTAQAEVGGIVFLPAVSNLTEIEKRLTALNKKASKLSTEPIALKVTDEKLVLHYTTNDEDTRGWDFEHVFTVLSGTTPKVPGFEFLATVTHTEHGNVIKRIPPIAYGVRHNLDDRGGEYGDKYNSRDSAAGHALESIDLSKYHTTGNLCEQCGLHRDRLDTFVVYNEETGETKQVGRNCLRDYTGRNNPEQVLKVLEQVWEFMRSMGGRSDRPVISTQDLMTHAATLMRSYGGYRKGLGHEAAENLYNFVHRVMSKDRKPVPLWVEPIAADEDAAKNVITWAADWDENSEFATNVKISLAGSHIDRKLYGYAGAAYVAYEKWMGRERARKAQADKPVSQHVGTIDQRETFTLTVTGIKWIENHYATSDEDASKPLIIMEDPEGNEVKWFASRLPRVADKPAQAEPVIGGTYQVKATVKRHEDSDQYGKSTMIQRAKFEKTIKEEQ